MPDESETPKTPVRDCWVGAPAIFILNESCITINKAFNGSCVLVGSALEKRDHRDVDVRCIIEDEQFAHTFGELDYASTQYHPRMAFLSIIISQWLAKQTGLNIDFQFQSRGRAEDFYGDKHHKRQVLGHHMVMPTMPSDDYIKNIRRHALQDKEAREKEMSNGQT